MVWAGSQPVGRKWTGNVVLLAALLASPSPVGATGNGETPALRAGNHAVSWRKLETVGATEIGCFTSHNKWKRDPKRQERMVHGFNSSNMTQEKCATHCFNKGENAYYGLQYGKECWCGRAGIEYDTYGSSTECTYECSGDSSTTCGGYFAIQIYEYDTSPQPSGHLGCFTDKSRSRILSDKIDMSDLTAEGCKTHCESDTSNNFYGLEYGNQCWCGPATSDYDKHGASDRCGYRCTGDASSVCGGDKAMDVFSMDGSAPTPSPPPATTPPTAVAPTVNLTDPPAVAPTTPTAPPAVAPTDAPAVAPTDPPTVAPTDPPAVAPTDPPTVAPTVPPTLTLTPVPVTGPPTITAVSIGTVLVDLQPCILTTTAITDSTTPGYMIDLFFKGYWGATQLVLVTPGDDLISLMTDSSDADHALCNSVYVGIVPTDAQYAALQLYSATFKVRIVYLETSDSAANAAVNARLGIQQYFAGDLQTPSFMAFTTEGGAAARILNPDLQTDPIGGGMYTRPVRVVSDTSSASTGTVTRMVEYLDSSGVPVTSDGYNSAAMMTWEGVDGLEELHMFVSIGWFDTGSWAWVHHMVEWATKGVFMGERRFYLGAVVDDLFLKTPEFLYDNIFNEGPEYRCSGADLLALKGVQDSLNAQYGSSIVTEFANNGAGILEQVESPYLPPYEETIVTPKGTKMTPPGLQSLVHPTDYLSTTVPLLQAEFDAGGWDSDDTLQAALTYESDFYHQSHTLIHLSRDELQESDCNIEDGANAQIAVINGMFAKANYNWRSMVSPGITGLFNANCLQSGANNLMTCYPGDNTYDGVNAPVSLLSDVNPYHSIYTTVETNGYDGMQIVPRFSTHVYYNCVSGSCLVNENEYIRRLVCGCSELNPSLDRGTCSNVGTVNGCNSNTDITSFSTIEEVFDTEASNTVRYLLSGHRDKYMFHQANVVPSSDLGNKSSLEYWYEKIMAALSSYISFPVKSTKFDDLCVNFQEHETLDSSGAVVTASVDVSDGSIIGMTMSHSSEAGLVPVTVPTASASSISLGTLTPYDTEMYGSDTTYYFATSATAQPTPAPQPDASELAPLSIEAAPVAAPISVAAEEALDDETEDAKEEAKYIAYAQGFVVEEGGVKSTVSPSTAASTTP